MSSVHGERIRTVRSTRDRGHDLCPSDSGQSTDVVRCGILGPGEQALSAVVAEGVYEAGFEAIRAMLAVPPVHTVR